MRILKILLILFLTVSIFAEPKIQPDCTFNGKKLYGRIKFVDFAEDIKVKIVDFSEDLKVQFIEFHTPTCGQWEVNNNFAELRVKIVTFSENIKIRFVDIGFNAGLP